MSFLPFSGYWSKYDAALAALQSSPLVDPGRLPKPEQWRLVVVPLPELDADWLFTDHLDDRFLALLAGLFSHGEVQFSVASRSWQMANISNDMVKLEVLHSPRPANGQELQAIKDMSECHATVVLFVTSAASTTTSATPSSPHCKLWEQSFPAASQVTLYLEHDGLKQRQLMRRIFDQSANSRTSTTVNMAASEQAASLGDHSHVVLRYDRSAAPSSFPDGLCGLASALSDGFGRSRVSAANVRSTSSNSSNGGWEWLKLLLGPVLPVLRRYWWTGPSLALGVMMFVLYRFGSSGGD